MTDDDGGRLAPARPGLVAVHAHPDDEALFSGALLAAWAKSGRTTVVTCTRGERGEVIPPELRHLEGDGPALAAHRSAELAAALAALGVDGVFLDELPGHEAPAPYVDSGMSWLPDSTAGPAADPSPGAFVLADLDTAADRLAAFLARERPVAVVTYGPDGGYGHPDHVRAHEVAMRAVELAAAGSTGSAVTEPWRPVVLWADGPAPVGVTREVTADVVVVVVEEVLDEVRRALDAHATQLAGPAARRGAIDVAVSNGMVLRIGPLETYRVAPGWCAAVGWPAGVVAGPVA